MKPNFLLIIADDLGFSDLGCYGGEINTPNLDRLARDGLRQTGFHTASACSPTRAMLMSGTDNHLAGLGNMAERMNGTPENQKNKPGYEGVLNQRVAALSEILNAKGEDGRRTYRTMLSGKWHLGLTEETLPSARGFERNWGLLPGCWHHCEASIESTDPVKYTPVGPDGKPLFKFMPGIFADGSRIFDQTEIPEDFYSSKTYTDKMIGWMEEDDASGDDRPFFAMMTYTAPHWPLQAPPEYIEKYKGRYHEGPSVLRQRRMEKMLDMGIINQNAMDHAHPELPVFKSHDWDDLSPEKQKRSARTMEAYAGMVECLDHHIGRLLKHLEDKGQLDNTFVVFSKSHLACADSVSDNGAEGALLEATPLNGSVFKQRIEDHYDNTFDNIGKGNSFVWYGPRWAQAATAPSRLYKCWVTEGGTRCPCIVRYPGGLKGSGISHEFTTVMDILPTVLDLAGIPHPGTTFNGRKVHEPKGRSWVPWLQGKQQSVHTSDTVVGWELFGQQAIRRGNWKAIFIPKPSGEGRWELYNLATDPGETHDLYEIEADRLAEMVELWEEYEAETGMVPAVYERFGLNGDSAETEDW